MWLGEIKNASSNKVSLLLVFGGDSNKVVIAQVYTVFHEIKAKRRRNGDLHSTSANMCLHVNPAPHAGKDHRDHPAIR